MSLPLCIASRILNIKIFLFEPNMVLGRANRFFLNFCEENFLLFKIKLRNFQVSLLIKLQ